MSEEERALLEKILLLLTKPDDTIIDEVLDASMNMGDPEREEYLKDRFYIIRKEQLEDILNINK